MADEMEAYRASFLEDIQTNLEALEQAAGELTATPVLSCVDESVAATPFSSVQRLAHNAIASARYVEAPAFAHAAEVLEAAAELGASWLEEIQRRTLACRALADACRRSVPQLCRLFEAEQSHGAEKAWDEVQPVRRLFDKWQNQLPGLTRTQSGRLQTHRVDDGEWLSDDIADAAAADGNWLGDEDEDLEVSERTQDTQGLAHQSADAGFALSDTGADNEAALADDPKGDEGAAEDAEAPFSFGEAPAPEDPDALPEEGAFSFGDDGPAETAAPGDEPAPGEGAFRLEDEDSEPGQPGADAAFSFGDDDITDTPAPAEWPEHEADMTSADEVDRELGEAFEAEARELLVAVYGFLAALQQHPDDLQSAAGLERVFHTLKGAAATVGFADVAAQARSLEEQAERWTSEHDGAAAEQLIREANGLLVSLGMQALHAPGHPQACSPELQALFRREASEVLSRVHALLDDLEGGTSTATADQLCLELGRLFHRLKGSSLLLDDTELAAEAAELSALCKSQQDVPAIAAGVRSGLQKWQGWLDDNETEAVAAPEDEDAELEAAFWEAFSLESAEILSRIDHLLLDLEEGNQVPETLAELYRAYHTLKGAANTMGLHAIGQVVHSVEDLVENLQQRKASGVSPALTTLLLDIQDRLRESVRQGPEAVPEEAFKELQEAVAAIRENAEARPTATRPVTRATSERKEATADGGSLVEQRHIRLPVEQLDGLMGLVGELVVSRSRLNRHVEELFGIQSELQSTRSRLVGTVQQFRERYEFPLLHLNSEQRQAAGGIGNGQGSDGFSELELDRYEEINILARTLHEIHNDHDELDRQVYQTIESMRSDTTGFQQIVDDLQERITRARMVPIGQLFARLRRPVRDAAARENKPVRLETGNEDINVDKRIVDEIYLPMLHLVRNAVAHGIESPGERLSRGKPETGSVSINVRQQAGQIIIELSDDGAGLNLEALHARGIARGMLPPDTPLHSPLVPELIFAPGVSTRESADDVSGRGVGCDVVRREILRLNGRLNVSSEVGNGTRFTITLPLTLAIAQALLVRQHGRVFAVPLGFVERLLTVHPARVRAGSEGPLMVIDDVCLPLHDLGRLLQLSPQQDADAANALLLRAGERRFVVRVGEILDQEEIVVKGLGPLLTGHPMLSGVTITGHGHCIPILNVQGLYAATGQTAQSITVTAPAFAAGSPTGAPQTVTDKVAVLVVDDSLSVRKVVQHMLARSGVKLTLAVDGADALAKLRESHHDIVFTDLEMPRMNGYELIREMRYVPQFRGVPVVVISSRSAEKHRKQAADLGADAYLAKPFTEDDLQSMLRQFTRWRQGRSAARSRR